MTSNKDYIQDNKVSPVSSTNSKNVFAKIKRKEEPKLPVQANNTGNLIVTDDEENLQADINDKDAREIPDQKVLLDHKVLKVIRVIKEMQVQEDYKEKREIKVILVV